MVDLASGKIIQVIHGEKLHHADDGCSDNFCRGVGAVGVAISPDSKTAYVTSMYPDGMAFVNLDNGTIERTIKLERFPHPIVISRDGSRAYVLNTLAHSLSEVDLTTGHPVGPLVVLDKDAYTSNPEATLNVDLALAPGNSKVFVAAHYSKRIDAFDAATLKPMGFIKVSNDTDNSTVTRLQATPSRSLFALLADGVIEYDSSTLTPRNTMHLCKEDTFVTDFNVSPDGSPSRLCLAMTMPL